MVVVRRLPVQAAGYFVNSNPRPSSMSLEVRCRRQVPHYAENVLICALLASLLPTTVIVLSSLQRWAVLAFLPRKRTSVDVFPQKTPAAAGFLYCAIFAGYVLVSDERGLTVAGTAIPACAASSGPQIPQLLHATSVRVSFLSRTQFLPTPSRIAAGQPTAASPAKRPSSAEKNTQNMRHISATKNSPTSGAGDSWLEFGRVDQRRVRLLTGEVRLPQKDGGKSVVCYLQRDLRVQDNWALLLAHDAAAALRVPLHVVHLLVPALGFQPTPRHLHFFYGGARQVQTELHLLNIGFHVPVITSSVTSGKMKETKTKIEGIQAALQPAAVICDFFPLRLATQVVEVLTKVCEQNQVPLYQVDAHSVIPTWVASNRLEVAARTLRPRLHVLLKEFSTPFPVLTKHPHPPLSSAAACSSPPPLRPARASAASSEAAASSSSCSLLPELPSEETLRELLHAEGPGPVEKWTPGTQAGLQQLQGFCCPQQLVNYEKTRNDPLAEAQSNLSPYLHFGQLSQQRCLLEALLVKRGTAGLAGSRSSSSSGRDACSRSRASSHNGSSSGADTGDSQRLAPHAGWRGDSRTEVEERRSSSASSKPAARSNISSLGRRSSSGGSGNSTSSAYAGGCSRTNVITGVDAFVEELVVRCALSENFVFYCGDKYDKLEGAPRWAQESLRQHEKDPRVPLYDLRVLEAAETYDALWNASQQQVMKEGKMHGYLRMYWAKKMLEWMKSPADALAAAIHLNDKYSLDGTDPNGYAGCLWSIAALHDQPFKERPIYGKVRYMNYAGCQRKFNVKAFVQMYETSSSNKSRRTSATAGMTTRRPEGSCSKEESKSLRRRNGRTSSTSEAQALKSGAQTKAEEGAAKLGKALLTSTLRELRQQYGEAPTGDEEGADAEGLETQQGRTKGRKREQPNTGEKEKHHKQQKLQKHLREGRNRTLQGVSVNEPKQEKKSGEPRPKKRAKMEEQRT